MSKPKVFIDVQDGKVVLAINDGEKISFSPESAVTLAGHLIDAARLA